MAAAPTNRQAAESNLVGAQDALGSVRSGTFRADEVVAHSARAQVLATMAVAQALLEIGDVLRTRPADGEVG